MKRKKKSAQREKEREREGYKKGSKPKPSHTCKGEKKHTKKRKSRIKITDHWEKYI